MVDRAFRSLFLLGALDPERRIKIRGWDPRTSWRLQPLSDLSPDTEFGELYDAADINANLLAGDFRDRTWLLYFLGAFAVAFGALGILSNPTSRWWFTSWPTLRWVTLWHAAELVTIATIVSIVYFFNGQKLHEEWPALRSLAENIRYQYFIYPLAGAIQPLHQPLWSIQGIRADGAPPTPQHGAPSTELPALKYRDATAWLLHRLNIAARLPQMSAGDAITGAEAGSAHQVLDVVELLQRDNVKNALIEVVERQQNYHRDRCELERLLHERLKLCTKVLFGLTVCVVLARIFVDDVAFNFLVVFLPAFAAAVYGVSTQLEPLRVAEGAYAQQQRLEEVLSIIRGAGDGPEADRWERTVELRRVLIHAADLMRAEFTEWRNLVRSHQLEP